MLSACQTKEDERSDQTCRVCGEYEPIIEKRDEEAESAGCLLREAVRDGGVTCTVDNVRYEQLVITYSDCLEQPPCDFDAFAAPVDPDSGWDFECHICGDEGDVDSAHDNGVEDAGCRDSGILRGSAEECSDGTSATIVGFRDCDEIPACVNP